MYSKLKFITLFITLSSLTFVGCSSTSDRKPPVQIPEKTVYPVKKEGRYKVGLAYKIKGKWYKPKEDYDYTKVGIASWYGPNFHGKMTANGEIFDQNKMTAAHKTLPLPSFAYVENLENGKSVIVKINDRGPFSGSRIIDLSKRAAQELGFKNKGLAKVKVEILERESKLIKEAYLNNESVEIKFDNILKKKDKNNNIQVAKMPVSSHLEGIKSAKIEKEELPKGKSFYLQLGAFLDYNNAYSLLDNALIMGKSHINEIEIKGQKYYRVVVGPMSSESEVKRLQSDLKESGLGKAKLIVKNS